MPSQSGNTLPEGHIRLGGKLGVGRVALVDIPDLPLVETYHWYAWQARAGATLYARTNVVKDDGTRTSILMHKLLTGWDETDHHNHNGLDNRRGNLRDCTFAQNQRNRPPRKNRASKYKGVFSRPGKITNPWRAQIAADGKLTYIGSFPDEMSAALAYDRVAHELHGAFAWLNSAHYEELKVVTM